MGERGNGYSAPNTPGNTISTRAPNAAIWYPIIRIGAKMVVIRRRMHVEVFRVTLNGLGGFHMGNPGLK